MKKFFVLFAFIGLVSFAADAQEKVCTKSAKAKVEQESATAAAKLAAMDASIEQKVCAKSGTVSYVKKNTCQKSGKVSFTNVVYSPETAKFVNVSPVKMEKKAACSKKAACTKSKAACTKSKAVKTSATKKAACSKTCTKKAACSKSAKTTAVTKKTSAKLVKGQE